MITVEQLDMFEKDLATELKETKKWLTRVQKKLYRLEITLELLSDRKKVSKKIVDLQTNFLSANSV